MIWYPGGTTTRYFLIYLIRFLFLQFIPAILVDVALLLSGHKRFLVKIQKKIFAATIAVEFFFKNEWQWENSNFRNLYQNLSTSDKHLFYFNASVIDYPIYLKNWIFGSRKYVLKEDQSTIPAAKVKLNIFYWIDWFVRFLFYGFLIYFMFFVWRTMNHHFIVKNILD